MFSRPSREAVFMAMADTLSERSTCSRRRVACILTNSRGHVLATGYNGVPNNWPHCDQSEKGNLCEGASFSTGEGLDKCYAIHAEQNALLQCPDVHSIHTCYVTDSPCVHCIKLLLNTSCERILYRRIYSEEALALWKKGNRLWEQL